MYWSGVYSCGVWCIALAQVAIRRDWELAQLSSVRGIDLGVLRSRTLTCGDIVEKGVSGVWAFTALETN